MKFCCRYVLLTDGERGNRGSSSSFVRRWGGATGRARSGQVTSGIRLEGGIGALVRRPAKLRPETKPGDG